MEDLVWDSVAVIQPGEEADDPFAEFGVVGDEDNEPPPPAADPALVEWKMRLVMAVRRGDVDALQSLFEEDQVHGWIDTTERLLQTRLAHGMLPQSEAELSWFETLDTNIFMDAVGYDHEGVLEFLFSSAQYELMPNTHRYNIEFALLGSISLAKRRALGVLLRSAIYRVLTSSTETSDGDTFAVSSLLRRAAKRLAPPHIGFFVGGFGHGVTVSHAAPLDIDLPTELDHMQVVEDLVHAGGDLTPRYPRETNVLYSALATEKASVAQLQQWIALGADVMGENEWGMKPIHKVTDPEIIRMLVREGSGLNEVDSFGNTPLCRVLTQAVAATTFGADAASLNVFDESVRYLLQEGADPNSSSDDCPSALIMACFMESETIVLELLRHHADVNCPNNDGDTALHVACEKAKWSSLVPLLMEYGADPTIQNHRGETPVDRARHATGLADKGKLLKLLEVSH
ncbi:hypothetical protein PINS_up012731 [Pythium insidiosum]|nr:hypothetical protein PINS_up012731 [Pythium insidiosum]